VTEILVAAFTASLLGSFHCIGMCGGFVAFYAGTDGAPRMLAHVTYNLGRLSTYAVLGAVAGSVGAAVNLAGDASGLRQTAAVVAGSVIVIWGLALLARALSGGRWLTVSASPPWLNRLLSRFLPRLVSKPPVFRALVLGMASTLLPCGWLYGFAVTAAGSGTPVMGAAIMAAFWLGTVPAMFSAGLGFQRLARFIGPKLGVLMPLMLVVMGVVTVAQRGFVPMHHSTAQEAALEGEGHHGCH
jgi:hypothetical protein